jgi:hypothetical protein
MTAFVAIMDDDVRDDGLLIVCDDMLEFCAICANTGVAASVKAPSATPVIANFMRFIADTPLFFLFLFFFWGRRDASAVCFENAGATLSVPTMNEGSHSLVKPLVKQKAGAHKAKRALAKRNARSQSETGRRFSRRPVCQDDNPQMRASTL